DIENEIGRFIEQPANHVHAVAELDDGVAKIAQCVGNGVYRRRAVELFLPVVRPAGRRRGFVLEVEGEADAHRESREFSDPSSTNKGMGRPWLPGASSERSRTGRRDWLPALAGFFFLLAIRSVPSGTSAVLTPVKSSLTPRVAVTSVVRGLSSA